MLKHTFPILFIILFANLSIAQSNKNIQFVDMVYGSPIAGVMVFVDGHFECVSDEEGSCLVSEQVNEIYCQFLGSKDSLVNIESCDQCIIELKTNYNLLKEVEVDAKYNAKKHLLRLLEQSKQSAYELDTVLYYRFTEHNSIPETGQHEILSGIMKIKFKGYKSPWTHALICQVDNYHNSLDSANYAKLESNQMSIMLNSNVLFSHTIKRVKRKSKIEKHMASTADSASFLVLPQKKTESKIEYNYISFSKDKLKSRAWAGANFSESRARKYYFRMDFCTDTLPFMKELISSNEYIINDSLTLLRNVKIEMIDKPAMESDLDASIFRYTGSEIIERIKEKFPEVEIPSLPLENKEMF